MTPEVKSILGQSWSHRHFSLVILIRLHLTTGLFFFFLYIQIKRCFSFLRFNHFFQLLGFNYSFSEDLLSAQWVPRTVLTAGDTTLKTGLCLYTIYMPLNSISFSSTKMIIGS